MIGRTIGPYQILAELGRGGMGEVYRARDTKLTRDVALKILPEAFASDPDRLMRFTREAQTLASLNHPNIAAIYGIEDRAIVMELVEGEDLSARVARGAMPLDEAIAIARQIAEALEAAHEAGIIHRDLKPANIKVRDDGTVKLLDFGLAKAMDPSVGGPGLQPRATSAGSEDPALRNSEAPTVTSPALTAMGLILGTAAYMSPEQARGRPVDRRADIWAFGVVLYEMVTGRRLFDGPTVSDTLAAVLRADIDLSALPASTPSAIRRLLTRCLDRDPKNRLQHIGEARVVLADPGASVAVASEPPRWWQRPVMVAGIAAVGVVGGLMAGGWLARGGPELVTPARALIEFPIGDPTLGSSGAPALSWNGELVAWPTPSGLQVRRLDSPTVRTIAGTESALEPAWLPDDSGLVYSAPAGRGDGPGFDDRFQSEVRVVDLTAQSIRTLMKGTLESSSPAVVVSPSSEVVAALNTPLELQIVPAAGGTPRVLVSGEAGVILVPLGFLRDGRQLLYARYVQATQATTYHLIGRDGAGERAVPAFDTLAGSGIYVSRYVPAGVVVFRKPGDSGRGREYLWQAVDPDSLEPIGALETMEVQSNSGRAVSPDGRVMAWYEVPDRLGDADRPFQLFLVGPSRPATPVGRPENFSFAGALALAPDGRRLAVAIRNGPDTLAESDLWVINDLARPELRVRLTRTPDRAEHEPSWTADGTAIIALSLGRSGGELIRLAASGADTSEIVRRFGVPAPNNAVLTADGRTVLVATSGTSPFELDLYIFAVGQDGAGTPYRKTAAWEYAPRLSPDNQWVAFTSREGSKLGLFLDRFPTPRELIPIAPDSFPAHRWSADGKQLFYMADGQMMAVSVSADTDPVVGPPRAVVTLPKGTRECEPLPDGRFLCTVGVPRESPEAEPDEPVRLRILTYPFAARGR